MRSNKRKPVSPRYRPIRRPDYTMIEVPGEVSLIGMCFGIAGITILAMIASTMGLF